MKWYLFPYYYLLDLWLILRNRAWYYLKRNPSRNWTLGEKGDVLLIHGANGRWVSLEKIGVVAHEAGYRVHIVKKLGFNAKPVLEEAKIVAQDIKSHEYKNIIVIGHSKGGIIAIELLKDESIAKRITKVINIAGPLKGTLLSRFSPISRDLEPSSPVIAHLYDGVDTQKIVNIYPKYDDFVIPNSNLVSTNSLNKRINIFGHIRVVEDEQTMNVIKAQL